MVLVVGDVFDTAAPNPEAERNRLSGATRLAATGAEVVVLSGNQDNERALQAVAPLLGLGRIVTRASFPRWPRVASSPASLRPAEPWQLAVVPFLSQRWVVRAADC